VTGLPPTSTITARPSSSKWVKPLISLCRRSNSRHRQS